MESVVVVPPASIDWSHDTRDCNCLEDPFVARIDRHLQRSCSSGCNGIWCDVDGDAAVDDPKDARTNRAIVHHYREDSLKRVSIGILEAFLGARICKSGHISRL